MSGKRFMTRTTIWGLAGMMVGLHLFVGCNKKESDELITMKGRVEKVRRITDTTGELTVRFFSDKQNKDIVGTAQVTPETRIEKNGAPASFQDLQEGMQVNGQVRIQKEDGQRKFNAVRVQIETPKASSGG